MSNIPSKKKNPKGLHQRYSVTKLEGEIDPRAEYFVLRLDDFGTDPRHIAACRKAILTYAEEIQDHLPKLAADIFERYEETVDPDGDEGNEDADEENDDLQIEKCVDLESSMDWVKDIMSSMGPSEYNSWIRSSDKDCLYLHHGFGTWVRNTLKLWFDGPPVKWFNEHGIYHADDMSSIILQSLHRRENKREIDLEGQIKVYRKHWDKYDPDVNKGLKK